ncbi:MAG: hypothetical protein ACRC67_12050 [Inquilinus sp.]|uniref:hypothetical protein n=1 Tax=Inquilinus sp. TaxID=1932117 RepID=UPI003F322DC1
MSRHHEAWAAGALSFQDIASEHGVSRQAVRKAFQRRGWTKTNARAELGAAAPVTNQQVDQPTPPADPTPQTVKPSPPPPMPNRDNGDWLSDEQRRQLSAMMAQGSLESVARVIKLVHGNLAKNPGDIGPAALAAYTRTLRGALEIASGLLHREDDNPETLTAFRVETMSDDDVRRIKEEASAVMQADEEEPAPDSRPSVQHDLASDGEALQAVRVPPPIDDNTPLPGRADLRAWLLSRARSHGRRHMRDIAEHVGLKPALQDSVDYLVDSIVHAIDGDPERFRRPRS